MKKGSYGNYASFVNRPKLSLYGIGYKPNEEVLELTMGNLNLINKKNLQKETNIKIYLL